MLRIPFLLIKTGDLLMAKKPTHEELEKEIVPKSKQIQVSDINIDWNVKQGTCNFENLPVALMWVDTTLAGLMSGVQSMVGTERFGLALQSEGRKSVEEDWKVISQYSNFQDGFKAIANIAAVAGWGDWELISFDQNKKKCQFRVKNSWEGRYQKSLGVCWNSGMLAGKMAGYCSKLFKTNCWSKQTTFIAKGDDFDEFEVVPSERSIEMEIENLLLSNEATRADMAVALHKLLEEIEERKAAEEALRKSEASLRSIFRAAPTGIGVVIDRVIKQANEKLCEMLGYSCKEMLGQNARMLYPTDEEFEYVGREKYAQICERGTGTVETRWQRKDGKIIDVLLSSTPIDPDDLSMGVTFTALDITSRKQSEDARRESEEKYRLLFENTGTATFVVEEDMTVSKANAKCEELSGFSRDEIEGKMKTTDFIPVEELERIKKYHAGRRDVNSKIPSEYEFKFTDRTGNIKNVFIQVSMIPGTKQSIASITDITPLKEAEKAFCESEEKYKELANSLPQVVYEMDANGIITFANRNAFKFFGYTQDDFDKGLNALHMLIPEDRDRAFENILRRFNGEEFDGQEYTALKKDGNTFPIVVHVNPVIRNNNPMGLRGIIIDITDRKQSEEEKKKLEVQLQQAQKMESIGTLAGGIAHDFNNILGIIIGNTELALDDVFKQDRVHSNLEEILTAGQRAKDVVKQLLSFARKTELQQKPIKLIPVVKDSIKFLRSMIPTNIDIRQDFLAIDETIYADPTQIHQVMINLCTNAFHAMQETGGILGIKIEKCSLKEQSDAPHPDLLPGSYVKLTVSDTGQGIHPEIKDRIFDPYFTTKEVGKGTGMGLSVVHGIVNNYGGTISVESEVGKGAVFYIYFPSVEEETVIQTETIEEIPKGNERILFVDDDKSLTYVAQYRLQRLGYQVETKNNPIEALELFRTNPYQFDLVITDMAMPQMTGDLMMKEILKIRPDTPIILCTGFSEKIDGKKAKEIGAAEYVEKPIDKQNFAIKIRSVLDGKKCKP